MRKKFIAAVIAVASFAGLSVVAAPAASAGTYCYVQTVYKFGANGWGYYQVYTCTTDCRPGAPC